MVPGDKPAGAGAALATDDAQHLGASRSGAEASTAGAPVASGSTDTDASEPNGTWTADFKGEFPMGDGELCYPLTVQDMHSRFVLECWGRPDVTIDGVIPVFTRLFRRYGLPERIRTDNGTPFASNALGRLSRLSVWFIQVGILPELIEPGCPQQNGKHENMHLVLKRRTTRPPSSNMRTQQRAFREFRKLYTRLDRHEALDGKVPADLYRPSPRPFPKQLEPVTYPGHFETRLVSTNGGIRWYGRPRPRRPTLRWPRSRSRGD